MSETPPPARSSRARRRTALLAALALVAAALGAAPLAPSPAQAAGPGGSIVFVKDHDVWIAAGDGSGARPLTTAGDAALPYRSPSQSDTGIVVTTRYQDIEVRDQHGRLLRAFDPPALTDSLSHPIDGTPSHLAISPDGRLIAYTYSQYSCGNGCMIRSATGYIRADGTGSPAAYGTSYFLDPSWIGNARTVQSGGFQHHVDLHDVGSATQQHWFDDGDVWAESDDFGNVEVSPDGTMLAGVRGYGDQTGILTYAVPGDVRSGPPPAKPTVDDARCWYSDPNPVRLDDPTWSPDSQSLAWSEVTGVWTVDRAKDPACTSAPRLLIPGATEPDWSAAPLAAPLPPTTNPPASATLHNVARPRLLGTAKVGSTLRGTPGGWKPAATRVSYQWLRNGRPIPGATKARYRLRKADADRRIAVRVTAHRPGAVGTAVSVARKVRR